MSHQTRPGNGALLVAAVALVLLPAWPAHAAPDNRDMTIRAAVQERLLESPVIGTEEITPTVDHGVVTIRGSVKNMRERREAVRLAKAVVGVRAVVDEMHLPGGHRSDRAVAEEIQGALLFNTDTQLAEPDANIHVSVHHGAVTLRGTVRSAVQRRMATEVAYGVRGVTAVDNELRVRHLASRPDDEIKRDVGQALALDPQLKAGLVQVSVVSGEVHLRGVVGTAAERETATLDARVMGVKHVDSSGLHVRGWARDAMLRTLPALPTDTQIRRALRDALNADPRVPASDINVFVDLGGIGLSGAVKDPAARAAAEQDARNTVGVQRVDDDVRIAPKGLRPKKVCMR